MRTNAFLFFVLGALLLTSSRLGTLFSQETDASATNSRFTLQTRVETTLPNVAQHILEIPYIDKTGKVQKGSARVLLPTDAEKPYPLVFVPHYETTENSGEAQAYLKRGWAVASPIFLPEYNAILTDDDLVFNCATLRALRNMPEFDRNRVALDGGSAGGYMTLMLAGSQMGVCASIANAPIANVYFNIYQHFRAAGELNATKKAELAEKLQEAARSTKPEELGWRTYEITMQTLPIPILGMIYDLFIPILNNFPDPTDVARYEALSPIGLADAFSSPFIVTHCTSDMLVPVDQITREFTRPAEGETVPEGFSTRLSKDNPGILGTPLAELLPEELTDVALTICPEEGVFTELTFNAEKPFQLCIFDDGPTQGAGGHSSAAHPSGYGKTAYLEEAFKRALGETEFARPGKILLLLRRYCGKSAQFPLWEGVDDSVYGSPAVYRAEVVEQLARFASNHSLAELDAAVDKALEGVQDREELARAWDAIRAEIQ